MGQAAVLKVEDELSNQTAIDGSLNLDARLTSLIESDVDSVTNPFGLYDDLLANAPVYPWGPTVVVSSYEAVKTIARESDAYSNRGYSIGSRAEAIRESLSDEEKLAFDEVSEFEALYVSRMDGAEHARLRGIAQRAFRPRKMAALGDTVQGYIDRLIDDMRKTGSADFVDGLGAKLPTMMICSLLDIPLEDVPLIRGWAARIGKNRGGAVTADLMDAHAALREFREYVSRIVDEHYAEDAAASGDLVTALQGAEKDAQIEHIELLATIVVLLFGGSDTTTALLGNGLHSLLSNRDQWELLASDPEKHIFGTVEELARYVSPVQTTWRVTTEETELQGVTIPAYNTVLLMVGASNRDPEVFDNPNALDITREVNDHMAFLAGSHFCIGSALARLEATAVFKTLATRFPDLSLASSEPARFVGNIQFRTIEKLDLDWGV